MVSVAAIFSQFINHCQTLYTQERDPLHAHIVVPTPSYTYNLYVVPHSTSSVCPFTTEVTTYSHQPTSCDPLVLLPYYPLYPIYVYVNRTGPTNTTYVDWTELRVSVLYIRIYILIRTTYTNCLRPT